MLQGGVPRFEAFSGLRYNEKLLLRRTRSFCPPYDVIDDEERAALAARSPYNAIHVELPEDDAAAHQNRYEHAAAIFTSWLSEDVLQRESAPALYLYRMRFVDELGHDRSTLGVIGALEMDVRGAGVVLPHERTMPKPKGDRLDLLRATGINVSPIWGLSLTRGLAAACQSAAVGQSATTATDDEGVVHELIPIRDRAAIATISSLIASTPVVIADGHHRYETATFYREERRAANGDVDGDQDLVMAFVVELTPEELLVQPIHRLISAPATSTLSAALAPWFELCDRVRPIPHSSSSKSREQGAPRTRSKRPGNTARPAPRGGSRGGGRPRLLPPRRRARDDADTRSRVPTRRLSNAVRAVTDGRADRG